MHFLLEYFIFNVRMIETWILTTLLSYPNIKKNITLLFILLIIYAFYKTFSIGFWAITTLFFNNGFGVIEIFQYWGLYVFIFNFTFFSFNILLASTPVYSLFSLIVIFFSMAICLLLFEIQFLSYIISIVYLGAIVILFLFIIMMFDLTTLENKETINRFFLFWQTLLIISILSFKGCSLLNSNLILNLELIKNNKTCFFHTDITNWVIFSSQHNDIVVFAYLLYNDFGFILLYVSYILLSAMILAILLPYSIKKN